MLNPLFVFCSMAVFNLMIQILGYDSKVQLLLFFGKLNVHLKQGYIWMLYILFFGFQLEPQQAF